MNCQSRVVVIEGRSKCICRSCTDPPRKTANEPTANEAAMLKALGLVGSIGQGAEIEVRGVVDGDLVM
jgi:hypothetical protein